MMNNLSQNLSEALNKIKLNKLNDAEILYAKILESFPENYDANFYLGTIFCHLTATSESFFQLLFLWPLTSLILLFFVRNKLNPQYI